MKKVDPFSGIPAVPNSLAGQWLAFSHMANHYRKLMNVKPRVNSSAPLPLRSPTTGLLSSLTKHIVQPPVSPYLKAGKPKPRPTTPVCRECIYSAKKPSKQVLSTAKIKKKRPPEEEGDNRLFERDYTTDDSISPKKLLKAKPSNKSIKNKMNMNNYMMKGETEGLDNSHHYQMLYGPSSLKSSTDCALVSDCEPTASSCGGDGSEEQQPQKVRVATMGVAEKIKVFLDNLHYFENNPKKVSSATKLKGKTRSRDTISSSAQQQRPMSSCCSRCGSKKATTVEKPQLTTKESRHSNCFIPVTSPSGTPIKKKAVVKTTPVKSSNPRIPLSEAISKIKATKVVNKTPITTPTSIRKKLFVDNDKDEENANNKKKKRCPSVDSTGSVGTIRGSEELTTEVVLTMPNKNKIHQQIPTRERERERSRSTVGQQRQQQKVVQHKSKSRTRTPSAGYCSQSATSGNGKPTPNQTSMSSVGGIIRVPNKDHSSSRDSAYGFSSGESRITTRESTPEKLKTTKNKTSSSSKSRGRHKSALSTVASSVNFESCETTEKKMSKSEKSRLTTEDKYLNFLTEVTEDIISRGIYTNRGLKMLFKDHVKRNTELDVDRMKEMLERLRMDLGIPKDDSLNKLEFGYGSVLNSKTNGSNNKGNSCIDNLTRPRLIPNSFSYPKHNPKNPRRISGMDEDFIDEFLPPPQPHPSYNPIRNRSAALVVDNSESENSDEVSVSDIQSCKSEMSLSETELQRTLKEVGIDSKTTLEIVGMIKYNERQGIMISSEDEEHNNGNTTTNNNNRRAHFSQSYSTPASNSSS